MRSLIGSLLDILGLGLVVAGSYALFGAGVALVVAGCVCLLVSWTTARRRTERHGSEVA